MEPHISKSIQYTVNRGNKTINKQMIAQRPIIAFKIEITYHVLRYHNSGYDCDCGHLAAAADYPINEKKECGTSYISHANQFNILILKYAILSFATNRE